MHNKLKRRALIRNIIDANTGSTQEEIKTQLKKQGINISQPSLSRDLREMGVVKVPVDKGHSIYRLKNTVQTNYGNRDISLAMKEFCLGYEAIGNFMVIKTKAGNARDLCLVLDRQNWKEIVGTVAGDDTILVIARTLSDIRVISEKFKQSV